MPTLILLPGLDGTGILFEDFVAALGSGVQTRVVFYPSDSPFGYSDLEHVARSFIPPTEPFVLLAESFSGPIAISIASSRPQGLKGLILCCSFARAPWPLLTRASAILGHFRFSHLSERILAAILLGRFADVRHRNSLKKTLAVVSTQALEARIQAVSSVDVSPKLREIQVPILYLRATKDILVRKSSMQRIASIAQNVKVAEIEAPHLLLQTVPATAAQSVRDFLDEISRAGTATSSFTGQAK